jgi:murein DD-endopeptidase MepM/ murein hydrolase activator NlpD/F0F1-type ATP synthase assembly protein I
MATIDSRKLLPAGKPGGSIVESQKPLLIPVNNVIFKKDVKISQKLLKPVDEERDSGGSLVVIKKKVLKISDVINSTYLIEQSENNRKRKERERQKAEEREKKLETRKPTKADEKNLAKVSLPGGSILDAINRFLGFTLLGYLFDKYNQFLPKLAEFSKLITPVAQFIETFAKNAVNSVINFIDLGYRAYDSVNKMIKDVGGEGAAKQFEQFSTEFNKLLNGAIMAAMLIASTAPRRPGGAAGGLGAGTGAAASASASAYSQTAAGKSYAAMQQFRNLPKWAQNISASSASRYSASQSRIISGTANIGDKLRVGTRGFIPGTGDIAERIATRGSTQASKQASKQVAKQSLKSLVAVPVIGALIGFIIDTVVFREKPSRAAAGAIGSGIGQAVGIALAGGTTFGLGAGIGMFVGGFVGDWLGKTIYDGLTGFKPEPTEARAQGGQISGGQSRVSPTRRIRKTQTRQRRTYVPQKTQPGKDIGGKQKIEQLYGKDEPGKRSALRALRKSSEDLKKMKALNGVAGAMFGAGIDMSLGQKPDKKLATSLGNTFGSVIQAAVDAELDSSFNDISKTIAMANGGVVPSREIKGGMSIGEKIGKYISSAFSIALESSASKVLQNLNQEFNLEGGAPGGMDGGAGGGAGGYSTGSKNFVPSKEIYDYLRSKGVSHIHAMGMLANIQAESSFDAGAIGDNGTSGGLFQHHAERFSGMVAYAGKDWASNWKRQVDYALREGAGKQYVQKQFKTAAEASAWFTLNFERPSNKEQKAKDRIDNLKNFGPDGSWKGASGGSVEYVAPNKNINLKFMRGLSDTHKGADIAAPEGTPLRAVSDGEIIEANVQPGGGGWGNYIVYKDDKGIYHLYGHLQNGYKKSGKIKKGDIIAKVGMTGRTTGPHLHWEIGTGWNGVITGRLDPMKRYSMNAPFFTAKKSEPPKTTQDKNKPSEIFNWDRSSVKPIKSTPDVATNTSYSQNGRTVVQNTTFVLQKEFVLT